MSLDPSQGSRGERRPFTATYSSQLDKVSRDVHMASGTWWILGVALGRAGGGLDGACESLPTEDILWLYDPKFADVAVTAIFHWSQVQDLCLDLSLVAFSEFYFYLKSVLTGMNSFTKKSLPSGLLIFPESLPYPAMFPRGAEGAFTFVWKRNEDYRFLKQCFPTLTLRGNKHMHQTRWCWDFHSSNCSSTDVLIISGHWNAKIGLILCSPDSCSAGHLQVCKELWLGCRRTLWKNSAKVNLPYVKNIP